MRFVTQVFIYTSIALTVAVNQKNGDEGRPYEFGFTIDGQQHRHEKKDENGIIQGEFGFITADGVYHVTVYATDENGNFKILSMKNIRISAPLDGSPAYGPISPEAGKYLGKSGQPVPAAPQPVQKFERIQQQPVVHQQAITEPPKKFYDFTTQPTIKPACGGCGYVTTAKPFKLQYQNPENQKAVGQGPTSISNAFGIQSRFENNAVRQSVQQQNGLNNVQTQKFPLGPIQSQGISQGPNTASVQSQGPTSAQGIVQPSEEPYTISGKPLIDTASEGVVQLSQGLNTASVQGFNQLSQGPYTIPVQSEGITASEGIAQLSQGRNTIPDQSPQGPYTIPIKSHGSTASVGIAQPPQASNTLPVQPQSITSNQSFIQPFEEFNSIPIQPQPHGIIETPQEVIQTSSNVELLPPGLSPSILPQTNNLQVQKEQSLAASIVPSGRQPIDISKPTSGIQSHSSLKQPFSPPTQNRFDPVDITQGPSALNSAPFVDGPAIQQHQRVSTLPPITVSDNEIHVGGKSPQNIPIQDKFPGMTDGLPDGIDETDVTGLLYKFKYIVGFHGHYEKGLKNGAKIGGYFVNGRDGYSRVVTYVADEYGYRPKFKLVKLGLDSPDTPKEDTEKTFGLKSFEFVWYPIEG